LDWFLDADLSGDDAIADLCRFTFRPRISAGASQILPGHEPEGRHAIRDRLPRAKFVAYYAEVQDTLRFIRDEHAAYLRFVRDEGVESGDPRSARARMGLQFVTLSRYLEDVRLDVARMPRHRLSRPLRPEHRSVSLVGELALAMFQRLLDARSTLVCQYCKQVALFADRRRRSICGREECRASYRTQWKRANPESPEQVARRVRKHRGLSAEMRGRASSRRKAGSR